jgi:hypothetical protein
MRCSLFSPPCSSRECHKAHRWARLLSLCISFVYWEYRLGSRAMMPLALFKRRTQIGTCLEAFFLSLGLLMATYYLPLWYQVGFPSPPRVQVQLTSLTRRPEASRRQSRVR